MTLNGLGKKYCSNQCQANYSHEEYIQNWQNGIESGSRGIKTKNLSEHLKSYIYEKYKNKCCLCNFIGYNEHTGNSILEIDHIDGDSRNNFENNLRLLCPNCHAQSSNYKNLNSGNGREWRREKYLKN